MASINSETYLQDRLDQQLTWLSQASRTNKHAFLRLRILEILLGTSITIFSPFSSGLPWGSLIIALAGGGIAVSGSLLALNRHQENWLRYRSLAEALKREKYLFLAGTAPYNDSATAFPQLVAVTEALLGEENSHWNRQMSQHSETAAPQTNETRVS